jgi:hypothetical protein
LIDPSILKTERPPVTCARSKSYCGRRNRPTAPPAPPAEAGSFLEGKTDVPRARTLPFLTQADIIGERIETSLLSPGFHLGASCFLPAVAWV